MSVLLLYYRYESGYLGLAKYYSGGSYLTGYCFTGYYLGGLIGYYFLGGSIGYYLILVGAYYLRGCCFVVVLGPKSLTGVTF
jgi:hypothetical protein